MAIVRHAVGRTRAICAAWARLRRPATASARNPRKLHRVAGSRCARSPAPAAAPAAEAAALAATRESIHKKFQATADAAQAKYEYAMANAAALKQKADDAQHTYEASVKKSQEDQAASDKQAASMDAHDAEDTECALDGSECLSKEIGRAHV